MSQESSDYIPSQTPDSEDYTSYESSSLETESESEYSIASSGQCSGSSDLNSSFYDNSLSQSYGDSDSQSSQSN